MNKRLRIAALLAALLLATLGTFYLVNPHGTASKDPRARLLGVLFYPIGGVSNLPSIAQGDIVHVSTSASAIASIGRGDFIAFLAPHNGQTSVKRAIAFGGETVAIADGVVRINGQPIEEPYVAAANNRRPSSLRTIQIPEGKVFVLGDNRDASMDSRYWGFVDVDAIIGRSVEIYAGSDPTRAGD